MRKQGQQLQRASEFSGEQNLNGIQPERPSSSQCTPPLSQPHGVVSEARFSHGRSDGQPSSEGWLGSPRLIMAISGSMISAFILLFLGHRKGTSPSMPRRPVGWAIPGSYGCHCLCAMVRRVGSPMTGRAVQAGSRCSRMGANRVVACASVWAKSCLSLCMGLAWP